MFKVTKHAAFYPNKVGGAIIQDCYFPLTYAHYASQELEDEADLVSDHTVAIFRIKSIKPKRPDATTNFYSYKKTLNSKK